MKQPQSITLFMLVTNSDCMFGDYAVKSVGKIYQKLGSEARQKFVLYIYLNSLTEENKKKYTRQWQKLPYVTCFDNSIKEGVKNLKAGDTIVSPEGISRIRDDSNENYDELWTSELSKFKTDYIATIDADFEVLNPDFYFYLIAQLQSEECLVASTSYSPSSLCFDTFSNRTIYLHERNHTWCCIYKHSAFDLSKRSHFYYETKTSDEKIHAYDSAAYFQAEPREQTKLKFVHLPNNFLSSFIHYGAGSKNKSINATNVAFYRFIIILCNIGLIYGAKQNKLTRLINKVGRKTGNLLFGKRIKSLYMERTKYVI